MKHSPDPLLDYVCDSFLDELHNLPRRIRQKGKVGLSEIQTAVNALGWDNIEFSSSASSDAGSLSKEDLHALVFEGQIPRLVNPPCELSVYLYGHSSWKHTSHVSSLQKSSEDHPSLQIPEKDALPAGMKELLAQIQSVYGMDSNIKNQPVRISESEIQQAISNSSHLHICYRYLIQFVADHVRIHYQKRSCLRQLQLIETMLKNPSFHHIPTDTFCLLSACLVMVATDFNLLSRVTEAADSKEKELLREHASRILVYLLDNKMGLFHAKVFASDILSPLNKFIRTTSDKLHSKQLKHELRQPLLSSLYGTVGLVLSLMKFNPADALRESVKESMVYASDAIRTLDDPIAQKTKVLCNHV